MTVRRYKLLLTAVLLFLLIPLKPFAAADGYLYASGSNGREAVLDDQLDFFTPEQEAELFSLMQQILDYGNVAVVVAVSDRTVTDSVVESTAVDYYHDCFNGEPDGLIFAMIMDPDLGGGSIGLYAFGSLNGPISDEDGETIMDNAYNNVARKDYYGYAKYAITEAGQYLKTGELARPMKWISNIFLAIVLGMMINFGLISFSRRRRKAKDAEILSGMYQHFEMANPSMILTNTTKVYDPPSSSGGGGGHGGGGGGGGHSGGSHRI
ncbi:MAG: TPM domain-containing protein [Lachnospiraceae bacterium]|nr:TPM domain-containing protein [Lachnospiraceae bacterium]